jgi:hypothetical protein
MGCGGAGGQLLMSRHRCARRAGYEPLEILGAIPQKAAGPYRAPRQKPPGELLASVAGTRYELASGFTRGQRGPIRARESAARWRTHGPGKVPNDSRPSRDAL